MITTQYVQRQTLEKLCNPIISYYVQMYQVHKYYMNHTEAANFIYSFLETWGGRKSRDAKSLDLSSAQVGNDHAGMERVGERALLCELIN